MSIFTVYSDLLNEDRCEKIFKGKQLICILKYNLYLLCIFIISILLYLISIRYSWLLSWRVVFLYFACTLAIYHLLELIIGYINNIIFVEKEGHIYTSNPGRYIGYVALNFTEIILYFALMLFFLAEFGLVKFTNLNAHSVLDLIYFTVSTLPGLGIGLDISTVRINAAWKIFVIIKTIYFIFFYLFILPIVVSAIKVKFRKFKE